MIAALRWARSACDTGASAVVWVVLSASVSTVLATDLSAQQRDLARDVEVSIDHKRLAVRTAAATKLAQAGDLAAAPVRAAAESRGRNTLPLALVDALARADTPPDGALASLLLEWARDRDFYWRAQSLDGLAARSCTRALADFRSAVEDPSHLMRTAGARGLLAVGDGASDRQAVEALLNDEDPRVPPRVGLMLLEAGDRDGAEAIAVAMLGIDRHFLDDPWGAREAQRTESELRRILGERLDGVFAEDPEVVAAARTRLLDQLGLDPSFRPTPPTPSDAVGGLDVRSCRNGDLYLSWNRRGELFVGLDHRPAGGPIEDLQALGEDLRGLGGREVHGRVVCDFLRLREGPTDRKAAPASTPSEVLDWLKRFASDLETSGSDELSSALRRRLTQFEQGAETPPPTETH